MVATFGPASSKDFAQATSVSTSELAAWLRHLLVQNSTNLQSPSLLTQFSSNFRNDLNLDERDMVREAYILVLEDRLRRIQHGLPVDSADGILLLGTRIAPKDARWSSRVGRAIDRLIELSVSQGDIRSAHQCLNFSLELGFDLSNSRVSSCAKAVGEPAHLVTFLLMARRSPSNAVQWLATEVAPADQLRVFSSALDTLNSTHFAPKAATPSDGAVSLVWLKGQLDRAITGLDDGKLRTDLLALLNEVGDPKAHGARRRSLPWRRKSRDESQQRVAQAEAIINTINAVGSSEQDLDNLMKSVVAGKPEPVVTGK